MACSVNVLQKPCDGAEEGVTSCISLFHRRLLHQSHIIASFFQSFAAEQKRRRDVAQRQRRRGGHFRRRVVGLSLARPLLISIPHRRGDGQTDRACSAGGGAP